MISEPNVIRKNSLRQKKSFVSGTTFSDIEHALRRVINSAEHSQNLNLGVKARFEITKMYI